MIIFIVFLKLRILPFIKVCWKWLPEKVPIFEYTEIWRNIYHTEIYLREDGKDF